jgi:hypothetical protein
VTPIYRCLSSVLHAVTVQKTINSIVTFFRTSVFFVLGSPLCVSTRASNILHVQYMLDMFSPRKSSSYLSKDDDLGFRKDEVFQSDPFSLHVIEELIYSPKFLLKINDFLFGFFCQFRHWTDGSCEICAWNATAA